LNSDLKTNRQALPGGWFLYLDLKIWYSVGIMKFILLVLGGFILLMIVNQFLGGSPI